jgi:hypothetical protein
VLVRYVVACIALAMAAGLDIVALDPYDTGRFALFGSRGVPVANQRLTAASTAREPGSDGAVIGNSTSQLIDPVRLSALTGARFVSLAIPATGPIEQLTVARWFVRHHDGRNYDGRAGEPLKALVFGLDARWCRGDGQLDITEPFPFWLYSDRDVDYLEHLINMNGLLAAERKLKLLLGLEAPLRADGFRHYGIPRAWTQAATETELALGTSGFDPGGSDDFAAVRRLGAFFAEVPPDASIVLLFLPRYATSLPAPGTEAERRQELCKSAFRAVAASRPRTIVIDLLLDGDMVRDSRNFWDRVHYREPLADKVEDAAAAALHSVAGG